MDLANRKLLGLRDDRCVLQCVVCRLRVYVACRGGARGLGLGNKAGDDAGDRPLGRWWRRRRRGWLAVTSVLRPAAL